MPIYVRYKVPLVVEVEVESGEVLSVHLDDEVVEGPLEATADGRERSASEREQALRVGRVGVVARFAGGMARVRSSATSTVGRGGRCDV